MAQTRVNGGGYVHMPDPPGARRHAVTRAKTVDIHQWAAGACPPGEPACQLSGSLCPHEVRHTLDQAGVCLLGQGC